MCKKVVSHSKILGERLFCDISSSSAHTFGGKKHWLLATEDNSNYACCFFLKEKSDLAGVMLCLVKNVKNKYNM